MDPTLVLTLPLKSVDSSEWMQIDEKPPLKWLDGFALAAGVESTKRTIHDAMVSAIAIRTAFATVYDWCKPVGFGLGVCERGVMGIFEVAVMPSRRGQGHSRSVMNALLSWGKQVGAEQSYLQVSEQNGIARNLYGSLGFDEAYRYHYRKRSNPPAFKMR